MVILLEENLKAVTCDLKIDYFNDSKRWIINLKNLPVWYFYGHEFLNHRFLDKTNVDFVTMMNFTVFQGLKMWKHAGNEPFRFDNFSDSITRRLSNLLLSNSDTTYGPWFVIKKNCCKEHYYRLKKNGKNSVSSRSLQSTSFGEGKKCSL